MKKTGSPKPASPGGIVVYTILVTNRGPADAVNSRLADPLPAAMTFLACSTPQGSCSGPPAGTNGTVLVDLGTVSAGASVTVTIQTRLVVAAGAIENVATVTSDTPDPDPDNNRDEDVDFIGAAIPTLSTGMLALMAAALALAALRILRR